MEKDKEVELLRENRELRELLSQSKRTNSIQLDKYNRLVEYVETSLKLLKCGCGGNPLPVDIRIKEEIDCYKKNKWNKS